MGEKWTKERSLRIQFERLQKKIPPYDLLTYRLVRMIRENPDIDIMSLFKEEVRNNLMLLSKVEEELGYNFYRYEKKKPSPRVRNELVRNLKETS